MSSEWMVPWKTVSAVLSVGIGTEGWTLAEHPGEELDKPRLFSAEVFFDVPFTATPAVHLSLTGFDIDQRHTARISVRATQITPNGFKAEISTWHDSLIYSVEASWLAIGP